MNVASIRQWILAALMVSAISGCGNPMAVKDDIDSQFFYIRPGSKLILHKDVTIPKERSHTSFQHGKAVSGLDNYTVGCVLDVRNLGPGTVSAGVFTISRAESSQEWNNDGHFQHWTETRQSQALLNQHHHIDHRVGDQEEHGN